MIRYKPSKPQYRGLPIHTPFFLLRGLYQINLLLVPPFRRRSTYMRFRSTNIRHFIVVTVTRPIHVLIRSIEDTFRQNTRSLESFLSNHRARFFSRCLKHSDMFHPRVHFSFNGLTISRVTSRNISRFVRFNGAGSS